RLELLEDRVQLGDTILGLSAVALWGFNSLAFDAACLLDSAAHGSGWHDRPATSWEAAAGSSLADSPSQAGGGASMADHAVNASAAEPVAELAHPRFREENALPGHRAATTTTSLAVPID